ncbi:MAG: rod shape-determining protein MreD [Leptolyngbyaceae bacterium]|nr:rod shape-determining protein MreD [Leptolyngbyaceae bacterium]
MLKIEHLDPQVRRWLDWVVTTGSVLACLVLLWLRLPGMELLGVSPNWMLIWVVCWSIKRSMLQGAIAGVCLGLIQDGLTYPSPTHAISLAIAGVLTARLQKQKYIQEDFISIALIAFGMAVVVETIMAIQFSILFLTNQSPKTYLFLSDTWLYHQQVALSSAILSSLWAPVLYFPLNLWWERIRGIDESQL